MKGLELARRYYEEYGEPMLREQFPEIGDKIAVGLCGSGSECFGFDDKISRDHDFEPGFCLFLPDENIVDRKTAFRLERAYANLPKSYLGFERQRMNPVGGNRHGVIRWADFFLEKCGSADGRLSLSQWLSLPESALAEAVNGEIFYDGSGEFTRIREQLSSMPEDVRRKRLAGLLVLMKQAGLYNYPRTLAHGESGAAQLAVGEFVNAAMRVIFLLNRRYMPYYKWSFRAMRELPVLGVLADSLEYLLTTDNSAENSATKNAVIADISALIADELRNQELASGDESDPEALVRDEAIRNLHILCAV